MNSYLADAIFWMALVCCAVAQLAILRSVIVSPARVPNAALTTVGRRTAEIAWAVLPGIALAVVFVYTWQAMHVAHLIAAASVGQ